jgi:hypothetical protein
MSRSLPESATGRGHRNDPGEVGVCRRTYSINVFSASAAPAAGIEYTEYCLVGVPFVVPLPPGSWSETMTAGAPKQPLDHPAHHALAPDLEQDVVVARQERTGWCQRHIDVARSNTQVSARSRKLRSPSLSSRRRSRSVCALSSWPTDVRSIPNSGGEADIAQDRRRARSGLSAGQFFEHD